MCYSYLLPVFFIQLLRDPLPLAESHSTFGFWFHLLSLQGMSAQLNIIISKRKCDSPVHAHMMTFNSFSGNNVYNGNKFAELIYITQCILNQAYSRKLFYQFKLHILAYMLSIYCCIYRQCLTDIFKLILSEILLSLCNIFAVFNINIAAVKKYCHI